MLTSNLLFVLLGIILADVVVGQKQKDFGGQESFLKNKIEVPHVPHGSGSVHNVSAKINIPHEREDELTKLLEQIYKNFVGEKQVGENYHNAVDTDDVTTHKAELDNNELKDTINKLLHALSDDKNEKEHTEDVNRYSKFVENSDDSKEKTARSGVVENSVDKGGFKEFKKKFYQTFFKRSQNGGKSIIFNGKKKKNDYSKKSLSELYDELKKEVDGEEREETVKKADEEIEKKKKDIISSLNKLFGEQKFVYKDHRVTENVKIAKMEGDEEFERLYEKEDNKKKSVEEVFHDAFKRNMKEKSTEKKSEKKRPAVEEVGEDEIKQNMRRERLRNHLIHFVNDLKVGNHKELSYENKLLEDENKGIVSQDDEKNVEDDKQSMNNEIGEKKRKVEKEELREYLMGFIQQLSEKDHVKKEKRFEDELEKIVAKDDENETKHPANPVQEISEALKGFEVTKRDAKDKYDRP